MKKHLYCFVRATIPLQISNLKPILGYTNTISFKNKGTTVYLSTALMQPEQCLIISAWEFIMLFQVRFPYLLHLYLSWAVHLFVCCILVVFQARGELTTESDLECWVDFNVHCKWCFKEIKTCTLVSWHNIAQFQPNLTERWVLKVLNPKTGMRISE